MPLKLFGVSGRYATAMYQAAASKGKLADVEAELTVVAEALEASPKFEAFLENPFIDEAEKMAVLGEAIGSSSQLTKNFFGVLAESNRLDACGEIIAAYKAMMVAARGEIRATVTLAQPMGTADVAALKKELEANYLGKGETLELTTQVDKDILGGYIVEIGDKYLDLSLSTRLSDMHKLLQESI